MGADRGFGSRRPGLWASLDPVGACLRTSVLSELEGLTGCVLTWRVRDTPSGRCWWVLGRSEPRTDESESGSWPTVKAQEPGWTLDGATTEDGQPPNQNRRVVKGGVVRTWGLKQAIQSQRSAWPTATAMDSIGSGAAGYSTESGRHPGTTLTDAANGLWASPQARDWKDSGPTQGNRKSPNLGTQAWVSPGASLVKERASAGDRSRRRSLGKQESLESQVMFPSPKASDGRSKGTGGTPDHGLDAMARAGLLDQGSHSTSGKSRDWPTARAGGDTLVGGPGKLAQLDGTELARGLGNRGSLNSRWVAQLMGYPPDWCDLPDEGIENLSKPMGTRSCRSSSRRSAGRSSRRKRG